MIGDIKIKQNGNASPSVTRLGGMEELSSLGQQTSQALNSKKAVPEVCQDAGFDADIGLSFDEQVLDEGSSQHSH